jgi:hypothetical protein
MSLNARDVLVGSSHSHVPALARSHDYAADDHLHTFSVELITEHQVVRAEVRSPESRLSDHLNSSLPIVRLRPTSAVHGDTRTHVDLAGRLGFVAKASLLFVVPLTEPDGSQRSQNLLWRPTTAKRCWLAVGPYALVGSIHVEGGRDLEITLRQSDKPFLPLTEVTMTHQDGRVQDYATAIVNRQHVALVAVKDPI